MSNPDAPSRYEELAALHALGLLDDAGERELFEAAQGEPKVERMVIEYKDAAAQLAFEAPAIAPPPALREKVLRDLPSSILAFHQWLPYAVAACLMGLGISQSLQIKALKSQHISDSANIRRLSASNALLGLRLQTLEAKDPTYAASKILIAWDPNQHRGVVALQNLPTPPTGHDYQLWVLDPGALAPVSAGIIKASRSFAVQPVSTDSPGFAVSLEPAGGQPEPTGPILFAVAPGP